MIDLIDLVCTRALEVLLAGLLLIVWGNSDYWRGRAGILSAENEDLRRGLEGERRIEIGMGTGEWASGDAPKVSFGVSSSSLVPAEPPVWARKLRDPIREPALAVPPAELWTVWPDPPALAGTREVAVR